MRFPPLPPLWFFQSVYNFKPLSCIAMLIIKDKNVHLKYVSLWNLKGRGWEGNWERFDASMNFWVWVIVYNLNLAAFFVSFVCGCMCKLLHILHAYWIVWGAHCPKSRTWYLLYSTMFVSDLENVLNYHCCVHVQTPVLRYEIVPSFNFILYQICSRKTQTFCHCASFASRR